MTDEEYQYQMKAIRQDQIQEALTIRDGLAMCIGYLTSMNLTESIDDSDLKYLTEKIEAGMQYIKEVIA